MSCTFNIFILESNVYLFCAINKTHNLCNNLLKVFLKSSHPLAISCLMFFHLYVHQNCDNEGLKLSVIFFIGLFRVQIKSTLTIEYYLCT